MNFPRIKIKHLVTRSDAGVWGEDPNGVDDTAVLRSTEIDLEGAVRIEDPAVRALTTADRERTALRLGDLLVVRSSGSDVHLGKVGFVDDQAVGLSFSNFLQRIRVGESLLPRFAWYFMNSLDAKQQIRTLSSTTTGLQNLSAATIGEIRVPSPDISEQQRITDFLNTEIYRIDQLIARQQDVITRLDERDQATLDLTIDDLVEDAGTLPFRRYIVGMDQGSSPQCDATPASNDEWGVLKVSCLRPGVFKAEENKRLPDDIAPDTRQEVHEGDLLIIRANTPQLVGSTAVVPRIRRRLLLSDKIFRVKVTPALDPNYVAMIARGSRVRASCSATSNGASQSMANIRFEEIKEWPIPPITVARQQAVVSNVHENWRHTQELRSRIVSQIDLLTERRQALITAAVTGQIDVSTASGRGIED